jgi:hypothetical protein
MGAWRTKLILLLIVYFAGFATAIYSIAPAPQEQAKQGHEKGFPYGLVKSDEFAESFNSGMHKCLDFSREAARHVSKFVKENSG